MKKLVSLVLAGIMTFGVSAVTFADESTADNSDIAVVAEEDAAIAEEDEAEVVTTAAPTEVAPISSGAVANATADDYTIIIDGREISYSKENTMFRDGTPLFPAKELAENFPSLKTDEATIIATVKPFTYSGVDYYAVEDVAEKSGFNFFYDSVTNTALVTNKETYGKILSLMQSVDNPGHVNSMNIDMDAKMNLAMNISGLDDLLGDTADAADAEDAPALTDTSLDQSIPMAMKGNIQMDIEKSFMKVDMDITAFDESMNVKVYDDGKNMYTYDSAQKVWIKTDSSLGAIDENFLKSVQSAAPALSPAAIGLTYGGLQYTETDNEIIIEGTTYLGESFKEMNIDSIMNQVMSQTDDLDVDADIKIDWPEACQLKYVFDKSGNIKTMGMKMSLGYTVTVDGITVDLGVDIDATITKYILNPTLDTTVPADILKNAVTMDQYIDSLPSIDLAEDLAVDNSTGLIQGGSIYDKDNSR